MTERELGQDDEAELVERAGPAERLDRARAADEMHVVAAVRSAHLLEEARR